MTWRNLFLILYNLTLTLTYILTLPYLIFQLYRDPTNEWRQRLGLYRAEELPPPDSIWIHAASMGEVYAATPLVRLIRKEKPGLPIFFTTMTRTGQNRIRSIFPNGLTTGYMPFDTYWIIRKMVKTIRPKMLIIVETELWFNLIEQLSVQKTPLFLINGRISDRTLRYYQLLKWGTKDLLAHFETLFIQNDEYAHRFKILGIDPSKITVCGSTKADNLLILPDIDPIQLRKELYIAESDFVIVVGSSREGEEEYLIPVVKREPAMKWIIAPRHLGRVKQLCGLYDKHAICWTLKTDITRNAQVIILNTMNELFTIYSLANLAIVGGTFRDFGGHNIMEPIAWQIPTVFGPYTSNVTEEARQIIAAEVGWQVNNQIELTNTIQIIRRNDNPNTLKDKMLALIRANTGSTNLIFSSIFQIKS